MDTLGNWRKSSYSGGGDGNGCVEIANSRTRIAVRDSKTPTRAALDFPMGAFVSFVESVKSPICNASFALRADGARPFPS